MVVAIPNFSNRFRTSSVDDWTLFPKVFPLSVSLISLFPFYFTTPESHNLVTFSRRRKNTKILIRTLKLVWKSCKLLPSEYYPRLTVFFISAKKRGRSSVVEHLVANENVVSSNLIARSTSSPSIRPSFIIVSLL